MRFRTIIMAALLLSASAAFSGSFAQSSAVSEKSFDWIFFAIVGIPFVIALVGLLKPDILEPLIREFPWDERRKR
ncbi:hypothetical protein [Acidisoma sp.]|uniref:hypothetical protein n=1 Tax=Acidisoma sp. TaxID=1872115 RepID=UPI003B00DE81